MISSRQLQAFVALVEQGTMTRAAEALDLTQPTVSKLVQTLEREVKVQLFVRTRQRLIPTPEALILCESARRMVSDTRRFEGLAKELHTLEAGRLEVIAVRSIGTHVLVDVLESLARTRSEIAMSLASTVERDVADWLATSQADWGFCLLPVDRADILCEPVCRFAACCALPVDHRLAKRSILTPADFGGERFISFRRDSRVRTAVDEVFVARGVRRRLNLEVYGSEEACAMVSRGMGVAIVEPFSIKGYVDRGEVVSCRFEPPIPYTLYLLRNRMRPPSQIGQRFLELFHEHLPRILEKYEVTPL
ncbi:MAG: LysR family transcriptional regulator [Lautropia sp.]